MPAYNTMPKCYCILIGPAAFRKFRPDLEVQFADLIGSGVMLDYLYHCNMQQPT